MSISIEYHSPDQLAVVAVKNFVLKLLRDDVLGREIRFFIVKLDVDFIYGKVELTNKPRKALYFVFILPLRLIFLNYAKVKRGFVD